MSDEANQAEEQEAVSDDWAAAMDEQEGDSNKASEADAQAVEAPLLEDTSAGQDTEVKLDVVLDIPITIAMEIGRTKLSIRNLLQLNQGSVVELDRFAGEPMDVLVNGTLVAHGEVVVVNEKFGIRLTDVISPADRIKNLR